MTSPNFISDIITECSMLRFNLIYYSLAATVFFFHSVTFRYIYMDVVTIENLPTEVLILIFYFLSDCDGLLLTVCRAWRNAVNIKNKNKGGHTFLHVVLQSPSLLQWAVDQGGFSAKPKWTYKYFMCKAHRGNHFETIKWLHAKGQPLEQWMCESAASNGNLAELRWFVGNGCLLRADLFSHAYQHLDVVQWLHAEKCPWDEGVCALAVANGYIKVLQWAFVHGCPLGFSTWSAARRAETDVSTWSTLRRAEINETKQWIRQHWKKAQWATWPKGEKASPADGKVRASVKIQLGL